MTTQSLAKRSPKVPSVFQNLFNPWNDFFDGGRLDTTLNIPAVNILEQKNEYLISLAVPGMKKNDFKIDVDGTMLTISSEKEETNEEKEKTFTRREFSYSTFSRSFTLPEEINKEKIEAVYEDGLLKIKLPFKEDAKKLAVKQIAVK